MPRRSSDRLQRTSTAFWTPSRLSSSAVIHLASRLRKVKKRKTFSDKGCCVSSKTNTFDEAAPVKEMDVKADARRPLHGEIAPPPLLKAVDEHVEAAYLPRLPCVADPRLDRGPRRIRSLSRLPRVSCMPPGTITRWQTGQTVAFVSSSRST